MDLICGGCGEPWGIDHVVSEPGDFERDGAHMKRCPACPKVTPLADGIRRRRAEAATAIGELLGDDLDGAAAMMEDAEMLGFGS